MYTVGTEGSTRTVCNWGLTHIQFLQVTYLLTHIAFLLGVLRINATQHATQNSYVVLAVYLLLRSHQHRSQRVCFSKANMAIT